MQLIKKLKYEILLVSKEIMGDYMKNNLYRRDGKLIYIKQPEFNELEYTQRLWNDEKTMEDIGGVFNFPKEKWQLFYQKMIYPSDGKNFYCLIYNIDNVPIGEVSFHGYDSATKIARFNIKIEDKYRRQGYGKEAIRLLLEYYFLEFGGQIMMEKVLNRYPESIEDTFGFEVIRQQKGEFTYRISKSSFLTISKSEKKNVCCVVYDGVDFMEVASTFELFNLLNKVADKEIFDLYTVGERTAKASNGVDIIPRRGIENELSSDILIIPGGSSFNNVLNDSKLCNFVKNEYKSSDFIIATGEGILLLAQCGLIKDHTIAAPNFIVDKVQVLSPSTTISGKNFVDNGRIVTARGGKSSMEGTFKIINAIVGEELTEKLLEYIE